MAKVTVTNLTDGPKVLNSTPVMVLQSGETAEGVEISDAESESAQLSEWFKFDKPGKAAKADAE